MHAAAGLQSDHRARDPTRAAILKKHIARIEEPRLRRAFQAAVELERESRTAVGANKGQYPWTAGIPEKSATLL